MQFIDSRRNPHIKLMRALTTSARERRNRMLTVLDGPHLVNAYLDAGFIPRVVAVASDVRDKPEIRRTLDRVDTVTTISVSAAVFNIIAPVETPTGIVAVVDIPVISIDPTTAECLVMLEGIQDPGNVGTIIRSAVAAGANAVLLSAGCADPWSPKVLRAGMGASFLVPVVPVVDLAAVASSFKGRVVATAKRGGRAPSAEDLTGPIAFVFGAEGAGISEALLGRTHGSITIPMDARVESLNVAAAAAVVMFERVRQLGIPDPAKN
jgi:TrmH family RNA methyltransferase